MSDTVFSPLPPSPQRAAAFSIFIFPKRHTESENENAAASVLPLAVRSDGTPGKSAGHLLPALRLFLWAVASSPLRDCRSERDPSSMRSVPRLGQRPSHGGGCHCKPPNDLPVGFFAGQHVLKGRLGGPGMVKRAHHQVQLRPALRLPLDLHLHGGWRVSPERVHVDAREECVYNSYPPKEVMAQRRGMWNDQR